MRIYSIFDDFPLDAVDLLRSVGADLTIHPQGVPRPDHDQMKTILEHYDCVIIGTSQKITEDMFDNISEPRIIASASVGLDHIRVPEEKKPLVMILNTPKANAQSVAEYTMGCALACCKRLAEGAELFRQGKNNKNLYRKPEDLSGKTIGVVGAGNISAKIMEYARFFGMDVLCWTRNPNRHREFETLGVRFVTLQELAASSDYISVNLPSNPDTAGIISADLVRRMKDTAVFISVSRVETVDLDALLKKAKTNPGFYLCLDIDVCDDVVVRIPEIPNVLITPHIAGGTIETRKRMFREVATAIATAQ